MNFLFTISYLWTKWSVISLSCQMIWKVKRYPFGKGQKIIRKWKQKSLEKKCRQNLVDNTFLIFLGNFFLEASETHFDIVASKIGAKKFVPKFSIRVLCYWGATYLSPPVCGRLVPHALHRSSTLRPRTLLNWISQLTEYWISLVSVSELNSQKSRKSQKLKMKILLNKLILKNRILFLNISEHCVSFGITTNFSNFCRGAVCMLLYRPRTKWKTKLNCWPV